MEVFRVALALIVRSMALSAGEQRLFFPQQALALAAGDDATATIERRVFPDTRITAYRLAA